MRLRLVAMIAILAVGAVGFWQVSRRTTTYQAAESQTLLPTTNVKIGSTSFSVETATTPEQLAKGLSGRTKLEPKTGMLFVFNPSEQATFWMKEMLFPLDFIWIKNGQVIDITRDVPPPVAGTPTDKLATYPAKELIDYVLEIAPNDGLGLKVGDSVDFNNIQSL